MNTPLQLIIAGSWPDSSHFINHKLCIAKNKMSSHNELARHKQEFVAPRAFHTKKQFTLKKNGIRNSNLHLFRFKS